jgi:hypothetical protein
VILDPNGEGRLQLRKPMGTNKYLVKAEGTGFRGTHISVIGAFLSKLSGLKFEYFRHADWLTACAGVFLELGQEKATEEQKVIAA